MRFITFIIFCSLLFSCVKKPSSNPVPAIEYKSFVYVTSPNDNATLTLSYEDGDGDIFRDNSANGPNIVSTIYIYDAILNQFAAPISPVTNDTIRFISTITQPGEGYKGKQVRGEIIWPLTEFRPNSQTKKFFYKVYMVDMKNNKSNTVTTPTFVIPP